MGGVTVRDVDVSLSEAIDPAIAPYPFSEISKHVPA